MNTLVSKLTAAQKLALSTRPQVGGFPYFAEVLRQAGVLLNRWQLPSCQSIYVMTQGSVVQQGESLFTGAHEVHP